MGKKSDKEEEARRLYYVNAAKNIPWDVIYNPGEKVTGSDVKRDTRAINVPVKDVEEAKENIFVQHLIKEHGFSIQTLAFDVPKKEMFTPKFSTARAKKVAANVFKYPVGTRFRVRSIGTILYVKDAETHATKGKDRKKHETPLYNLGYENALKSPIPVYEKMLDQYLKRETWQRLT